MNPYHITTTVHMWATHMQSRVTFTLHVLPLNTTLCASHISTLPMKKIMLAERPGDKDDHLCLKTRLDWNFCYHHDCIKRHFLLNATLSAQ